mmetsp:Transcript_25844/g.60601  ORF Transcript_25844/g.60601 Transcript_25844/m.60601 type:complete len:205 (-) Transcript_25844:1076-1690(-)
MDPSPVADRHDEDDRRGHRRRRRRESEIRGRRTATIGTGTARTPKRQRWRAKGPGIGTEDAGGSPDAAAGQRTSSTVPEPFGHPLRNGHLRILLRDAERFRRLRRPFRGGGPSRWLDLDDLRSDQHGPGRVPQRRRRRRFVVVDRRSFQLQRHERHRRMVGRRRPDDRVLGVPRDPRPRGGRRRFPMRRRAGDEQRGNRHGFVR